MTDKKHPPERINLEQGQVLVRLARRAIMEKLGRQIPDVERRALTHALAEDIFNQKAATFVTLEINNQLRGCIGSLIATRSLAADVRQNAESAAFHDPRFAPVSLDEMDRVQIEVSVLTPPQPLEYIDSGDLISRLRPRVDGVIIQKGMASATFLPQVWEQLPEPADFLTHLCQKAGLNGYTWRDSVLKVSTYQVQYFKETG
ncbi:MAG: AmmeMemoRadiSam system protein A [Deltaproteobacteria bacterium]|nr:MAG: AmmeMemoRadiSam system protein A [Deltaproteobacteria bacterium]